MKVRLGRVVCVALAAFALLSAAGCGSSGTQGATLDDDATPAPTGTPVDPPDDIDPVDPDPVVAAGVFAGEDHGCAALPAGGLLCWGRNGEGQVGDGTDDDRDMPAEVLAVKTRSRAATVASGTPARSRAAAPSGAGATTTTGSSASSTSTAPSSPCSSRRPASSPSEPERITPAS